MSSTEALISVGILGIALFVAGPKYRELTLASRTVALQKELRTIRLAIDHFHADTGGWPEEIEDLTSHRAPIHLYKNGKRVEWKKFQRKPWAGPYLTFESSAPDRRQDLSKRKDPVSQEPYVLVRGSKGQLKVFSSATGNDPSGTPYNRF